VVPAISSRLPIGTGRNPAVTLKEQALRLARAADELHQQLGRSPTTLELAEQHGLAEEEVLEALAVLSSRWEVSLDQPAGGDANPFLGELVAAPAARGGAREPPRPAWPGG
jgi:DNA-directed RNA polymerase sigma subunit (sigma70/sigma32)